MAWMPWGRPERLPRTSRPCGVSMSRTLPTTLPLRSLSLTALVAVAAPAEAAGGGVGVGDCPKERPEVNSATTSPARTACVITFLLKLGLLNPGGGTWRLQNHLRPRLSQAVQRHRKGARAPEGRGPHLLHLRAVDESDNPLESTPSAAQAVPPFPARKRQVWD